VVGVVGDVHPATLDDEPAIAIYYPVVPIPQTGRWYGSGTTLVMRTSRGSPAGYLGALRRAVNEVDKTVPLANAVEMETVVARSMSRLTFTMTLLAVAGVTALLLAAIGLYGLISYVVARRTNEIGVRLALGARPSQVEALVVRGALRLTIAGLAVGALGALAFARVLGSLLYGVAPWDPLAYLGAIFVLGVVALLAGWLPARRAAQVDPAVALRAD
jgi:ABC-type antimicrobial peptide transport system permease subunit